MYRRRNVTERGAGRLQESRRLATLPVRLTANFFAVVHLA
jgi:hypothetical protein